MALIKCKQCGGDVSPQAKTCPKCGAPVPKSLTGCLVALGVVGVFFLIMGGLFRPQDDTLGTSGGGSDRASQGRMLTPAKCPATTEIDPPNTLAHPFRVKVQASAQGDPFKPTVTGKTNLPIGTILMVSLRRTVTKYYAEANATVGPHGCFMAGPFTQDHSPINAGRYEVEVTMPVSSVQPEAVQNIVGHAGENMTGPSVRRFDGLGKMVEYRTSFTLGRPAARKDAEAKQKSEANYKEWQAETRTSIVLLLARSLKENLRNPASADWVSVNANDDASVVCILLRAQNGFGGMSVDSYTYINGKYREGTSAWNRYCAGKSLYNLTDTVRSLG